MLRLLLRYQTKEYRVGEQGLDVCYVDEKGWSTHVCWKDCDVVLLATKTLETHAVGNSLLSLPHPPKLIVSLQNVICMQRQYICVDVFHQIVARLF